MSNTPSRVIELVETFDSHIETYHSQQYNETQLRREFIDPFFIELGWDVTNKAGYAQAYKDVIHEDAIKIGGATKAPDYCFRIGGVRKFFLEAKKPSVNIKGDPHPAYQLRRYAWSAKLPLSILTDFEEFAVYDCQIRPKHTDKADTARIMFFTYKDYHKKWDEISDIFSKEAILKGSFDKFAVATKGKRGTTTVDTEFLKEIETWRRMLARIVALRNISLSRDEINFAVQRTIDRIIFLRMCEDRGIEPYSQLQSISSGDHTYPRLCEIFEKADQRYNSGLFHFHDESDRPEAPDTLTPNLVIDDDKIKWILHSLYYPKCPYEFSVLPSEILGNVYEQFLGKVITLTSAHRADIEEKPEVKKAGGVYYTPSYIVDYIVKNTVGKLIEGKTPRQIANIKILDPACGSGSFLLGAYTYLLNYHRDWYVDNDPKKYTKKIYQGNGGQWNLTNAEKKRILLNNIFGVDIDSQAVEVTKLSLLLKVLEGENAQTLESQYRLFHERALPDLANNIKCGNSLIGPDFYETIDSESVNDEVRKQVNPFDWNAEFLQIFSGKNTGFDTVIGNPPYGAKLSNLERRYLQERFRLGTTDTAALFMIHQNLLLRNKGFGGFIIPKPFTYASNWKKVRNNLIENTTEIADVSKVWKKVKLEQIIYLCQKAIKTNDYISSVRDNKLIFELGKIQKSQCHQFGFILNAVTEQEIQIANKLQKHGCFLSDFVINQRGGMLQEYIISQESDFSVLGGKQINRYAISNQIKGFVLRQNINDEKALIKPKSILAQNIIAHIKKPTDHIKIIATIPENTQAIILDTINQLENISNFSSHYLIGILNSKLISWYVYRFIFAKAIRTMHFDSPVTSRIPYPRLNLKKNVDEARHNRMISLVQRMLDLHKKLADAKIPDEKTKIQRQINTTDEQIDNIVYELYDLTEEEIAIVEGRSK